MDSKALAIVIIGVGIIVLIVSAAIGSPADGTIHTFSGWPAQAHIQPLVPTVLAATPGMQQYSRRVEIST